MHALIHALGSLLKALDVQVRKEAGGACHLEKETLGAAPCQ